VRALVLIPPAAALLVVLVGPGCGGRGHAVPLEDAGLGDHATGDSSSMDGAGGGGGTGVDATIDQSADVTPTDGGNDEPDRGDAEAGADTVAETGPDVAAGCGAPPAIANGTVLAPTTSLGSTARYTCLTNFGISAAVTSADRTCTVTGWSTPLPVCADVCTFGGAGSATHCCDSSACPASAPDCGANHVCRALPLGRPCTGPSQCASGSCVALNSGTGSVCCESSCAGICDGATCNAQGACQKKPSRTPCGTVKGTFESNDITLICDGKGSCSGPVVACDGTTSCNLTSSFCCKRLFGSTAVLSCASSPCGTAADLGLGQYGENCRGTSDCPTGSVCCQHSIYGYLWLECTASCGQFQLCSSQADCQGGQVCVAGADLGLAPRDIKVCN
jgi:hypothetical protein